jgi:polar amino acid transport system substrate-binding protein
MKKTVQILALMLAVALCFGMFAGCSSNQTPASNSDVTPATDAPAPTDAPSDEPSDEPDAESDLAYVQNKGTLVVGITDFAPMDYKDESGEWIGFDADMAKAFAETLGVDVEFVEINWDNKILELDGKTIDCVWNGMTLTDEVTSAMECSKAYCNNTQVVVVPADVADQYQSIESLSELVFAVEAGSAGEAEVTKLGNEFTPVTAQADALMEVAAGTSDAAAIDALMAGAMVGEGTGYADLTYTISLNEDEGEQYGVGFRKGSELAAALNDFFAAAYADGSMMEIAETYGIQAAIVVQ